MTDFAPLELSEAIRYAQELERRNTTKSRKRYIPHKPTPKQHRFLAQKALESFYGGAAGGGKSDALLMGALQYVHKPGYSAILFRRTYQDLALPGSLMDRADEWLRGTDARWNGTDKRWTFPSGATLSFGYLDKEADKFRYKSAEFQFVGFDELTQFLKTQYLYLISRVRRLKGVQVPLRVRSASNPGDRGHDWVKERFVDPGDPSRPFVAALLPDNPHLDQEAYLASLSQLDAITRAQLERGEWLRDSGGLIYPYSSANLVPEFPTLDHRTRYGLGIDLGSSESKPTSALILGAWHPSFPGFWAVRSWLEAGLIPSTLAERVREIEASVGGLELIMLDEGALGKGYGGELRQRYQIPARAAQKANKLGYRKLLRGDLEQKKLLIVEPQCEELIEEMGTLSWDAKGQDCEKGASDHCTDALLYLWRESRSYVHEPPEPRLKPGTKEYVEHEAQEWLQRDLAAAKSAKHHQWWTR